MRQIAEVLFPRTTSEGEGVSGKVAVFVECPLLADCCLFLNGSNRPILLKKSGVVFTAEKYAHEIEILNRRKGRLTKTEDWMLFKQDRLAALWDTPTAFGVSYQTAEKDTDQQWKDRASSVGTAFWLAFDNDKPIGMISAGMSGANRYNSIGMWIEASARGSGVAAHLVDAVKARAMAQGFSGVFLDVYPEYARAANFYLKQGFAFLDEWEPLESRPHITAQTMHWSGN